MEKNNNTYFVICFRWIENDTGFNPWRKFLKDTCIVKVTTAQSIADAFRIVKDNGFHTDEDSHVECLQSYIKAYEEHLADGIEGYYAV